MKNDEHVTYPVKIKKSRKVQIINIIRYIGVFSLFIGIVIMFYAFFNDAITSKKMILTSEKQYQGNQQIANNESVSQKAMNEITDNSSIEISKSEEIQPENNISQNDSITKKESKDSKIVAETKLMETKSKQKKINKLLQSKLVDKKKKFKALP